MAELKSRVVLVDIVENSKYKREKYEVIKIKRLGNDLFDKICSIENLALKQNYRISNIEKEGIDFLGFRHFRNKIILRKSIKNKLKNMTNKNISSYYGWTIPTDCYNLKKKYFKEVI